MPPVKILVIINEILSVFYAIAEQWVQIMKVLVLSDSHSYLSLMQQSVNLIQPDVILHLGDYYDDGASVAQNYPEIPFYQVPGNCDWGRCSLSVKEDLITELGGVKLFMTHGHRYRVKSGTQMLLMAARAANVQAVLFGHTHEPECYQSPDGMWVLNPGTCGHYSGSVGYMVIENEKIVSCRILRREDLEVLK